VRTIGFGKFWLIYTRRITLWW